ncbi:MAG: hypothetical protein ACPIOQ_11365, partial [Promethearchaeia archaeon]
GSEQENKLLEEKGAPTLQVLQAAVDRFWYTQARRLRRTINDLQVKQKRLSRTFEAFDLSLRHLEREVAEGRSHVLSQLWVGSVNALWHREYR